MFRVVDAQSKVSLVFILEIHFDLITSLVGQSSSARLAHTLQFLRNQISIVDLANRSLNRQLSPSFCLPLCVLKFARVHLVMLPMFLMVGQVLGFLTSSFASCQIWLCPGTLQVSSICSRFSIVFWSQCLHINLCSQFGILSRNSPAICVLWRKALNVLGMSLFCNDFDIFWSVGSVLKASSVAYHVISSIISRPLCIFISFAHRFPCIPVLVLASKAVHWLGWSGFNKGEHHVWAVAKACSQGHISVVHSGGPVDQQWRENDRKAKIVGYMAVPM